MPVKLHVQNIPLLISYFNDLMLLSNSFERHVSMKFRQIQPHFARIQMVGIIILLY